MRAPNTCQSAPTLETTKGQGRARAIDQFPTLDELQRYRAIAARIVKEHGEAYLPIFRRLHEEVLHREAENKAIESAIKYAES